MALLFSKRIRTHAISLSICDLTLILTSELDPTSQRSRRGVTSLIRLTLSKLSSLGHARTALASHVLLRLTTTEIQDTRFTDFTELTSSSELSYKTHFSFGPITAQTKDLRSTPSQEKGLDFDTETRYRREGVR